MELSWDYSFPSSLKKGHANEPLKPSDPDHKQNLNWKNYTVQALQHLIQIMFFQVDVLLTLFQTHLVK